MEDNFFNQEVIVGFLKDIDVSVAIAKNGVEALDMLVDSAESPFDVVLMDCQMPKLDGFSATKAIRSGEYEIPNKDVPVIAITAHVMSGDKERCIDAGMNDFIAKPVSHQHLIEKISAWTNISLLKKDC